MFLGAGVKSWDVFIFFTGEMARTHGGRKGDERVYGSKKVQVTRYSIAHSQVSHAKRRGQF